MSIPREMVSKSKLFGELSKLAEFENVTSAEIDQLKALVLDVAEQIGPHLDRVRLTFKQYTEHDLQHLLNIAEHIHNFVPKHDWQGQPVIHLNALELTFLWLAILLHDVGMFVDDAKEKQTLLNSDQYKEYLRHQRQRLTAADEAEKKGLQVKPEAIRDAIFAEFIRGQHAERIHGYLAKHFPVVDHQGRLRFRGGDLRTEIGKLCESHNWGVHTSRDSRRPFQCVKQLATQDRFGRTSVNFAYLACCLRLGDILDFDRTRTPLSAFQGIHFTEDLSVEEWNKHLSIKGVYVSEHRAEYVAACETPADYVAVQSFLNWCDKELQDCVRLIREFPHELATRYRLTMSPVVDRWQVQMKDPRYIAGGFRFQLEYDQIMKLLMDKSLYPDETLFLRELLQNSLDACRFQKARAEEAGMQDKYVPRIHVWDGSDLPHNKENPEEGPRIVFQDNGIGMSLDQVENFFMRVGKSYYRSTAFQAERERLAETGIHLDACSRFGIGFLSCFLGGDKIVVETYQYGGDPLKITIEGPRKYFVIEKINKPANSQISFNSPTVPADDSPPRCAGTKVTVYLRDGWHTSEEDEPIALVHRTLSAFAVNQEFAITIETAPHAALSQIPIKRWNRETPSFPGLPYSVPEIEWMPSVFRLDGEDAAIHGQGAIWLFNQAGKVCCRRGDVWLSGANLRCDTFVESLRAFCRAFSGASDSKAKTLAQLITAIRANRREYQSLIETARISAWSLRWVDSEIFLTLADGDQDIVSQAIELLPRLQNTSRDWFESDFEVECLTNADRLKLLQLWNDEHVSDERYIRIGTANRIALFGIETPGGFQTWNAAKGTANRLDWLPCGVSVQLDAHGQVAPEPAASRLFIPLERSYKLQRSVNRSCLRHAIELWKTNGREEWRDWFKGFLTSWDDGALTGLLRDPELLQLKRDLSEPNRSLLSEPDLLVSLASLHSTLGLVLAYRRERGNYRRVFPACSFDELKGIAKKAGVSSGSLPAILDSLSSLLGFDLVEGLPNDRE